MRKNERAGDAPRQGFRVGQAPRFLWLAACLFFCFLSLSEIWNFFHDPQCRLLDSEGHAAAGMPWHQAHFAPVAFMLGESCWYLAGLGLSLVARKRPGLFVGHVMLSVLWIMCLRQQF